jgi:hypothetical protein
MSGKNNVNKDFYTTAGRDRPNERVVDADTKYPPSARPGRRGRRPNFIPGAAPVGESPAVSEREAQSSAGKTGTRSGAVKQATARRGGKAPGKARPKSGAFGDAERPPQDTRRAKRGTTRAEATRRPRRRAA